MSQNVNENQLVIRLQQSNKLPTEYEIKAYLDNILNFDGKISNYLLLNELKKSQSQINVKDIPNYSPIDITRSFPASMSSKLQTTTKINLVHNDNHECFQQNDWPKKFRDEWVKSIPEQRSYRDTYISKGRYLRHSVDYIFEMWINNFKNWQDVQVQKELRRLGYTRIMRDSELEHEIKTRQAQFPGEQIIVLVGLGMKDYIEGISNDPYHWMDANVFYVPRVSYNGRYPGSGYGETRESIVENYESCVFSKHQIKARQSFEVHWNVNRAIRKFNIKFAAVFRFGLEILPRLETTKVQIEFTPPDLERFNEQD